MTNYNLLKSKMALVGDTMGDLAEYLNQSRVNLSSKINSRTAFSLQDVRKIKERYNLTNAEVYEIFIKVKRGEDSEQVDCEGSCEQT